MIILISITYDNVYVLYKLVIDLTIYFGYDIVHSCFQSRCQQDIIIFNAYFFYFHSASLNVKTYRKKKEIFI